MSFFVYIIESEKTGDLYKGFSESMEKRLNDHNAGFSKYTSSGIPWRLVFLNKFESKTEALKEEKRLKRCNRRYLEWLITQPINLLNNQKTTK